MWSKFLIIAAQLWALIYQRPIGFDAPEVHATKKPHYSNAEVHRKAFCPAYSNSGRQDKKAQINRLCRHRHCQWKLQHSLTFAYLCFSGKKGNPQFWQLSNRWVPLSTNFGLAKPLGNPKLVESGLLHQKKVSILGLHRRWLDDITTLPQLSG